MNLILAGLVIAWPVGILATIVVILRWIAFVYYTSTTQGQLKILLFQLKGKTPNYTWWRAGLVALLCWAFIIGTL